MNSNDEKQLKENSIEITAKDRNQIRRDQLSDDPIYQEFSKQTSEMESESSSKNTEVEKSEAPSLHDAIIGAIEGIFDPEIPVNVYALGLIYEIRLEANNNVYIAMTLTSPACPVAQSLPLSVQQAVQAIPEINDVHLELVWDPPWTMERMSTQAKLELGMMWE